MKRLIALLLVLVMGLSLCGFIEAFAVVPPEEGFVGDSWIQVLRNELREIKIKINSFVMRLQQLSRQFQKLWSQVMSLIQRVGNLEDEAADNLVAFFEPDNAVALTSDSEVDISSQLNWTNDASIIGQWYHENYGGMISNNSGKKASDHFDCSGYNYIRLTMTAQTGTSNISGICFYDETGTAITGGTYISSHSTTGAVIRTYEIPYRAVSFRTTFWNTDSYGSFSCFLINDGCRLRISPEMCAQGCLNDDGTVASDNANVYTTDYIPVPGSAWIEYLNNALYNVDIMEYDDNKQAVRDRTNRGFNNRILLSEETAFIRINISQNAETKMTVADVKNATANIFCYEPEWHEGGWKKPYTEEWERFQVRVNIQPVPTWNTVEGTYATSTLDDREELVEVTGVIALPKNYTPDGEPTKLILMAHGGHGYVDETHWYPTIDTADTDYRWTKTIEALLAAGYAVFDCNGYKDTLYEEWYNMTKCGDVQISEGLPQVMQAYYKCYEYLMANYNLSPQIYIWGNSQGGHLAMNFSWYHRDIVAATALCSGQLSLEDQGFDYQTTNNKKQVGKLLGFTNYTAYEHAKADPWDPMKRIVSLPNQITISGAGTGSSSDADTDISSLFSFTYKDSAVGYDYNIGYSGSFDTAKVDMSAYAGRTIRIAYPAYTSSTGARLTNHIVAESTSGRKISLQQMELYTDRVSYGILKTYTITLPTDIKDIYTSIFNEAAVAEGRVDGENAFSCVLLAGSSSGSANAQVTYADYVLGYNTPTKFFYTTTDTVLPQYQYVKRLAQALKNSAVPTEVRWYEGFSHGDVSSGGDPVALREVITWFNRF